MSKKRLGKGLESIFGDLANQNIQENQNIGFNEGSGSGLPLVEMDISFIYANEDQPRKFMDKQALEELSVSIQEKGVLQPILLHQIKTNHYQIIAGERRYQAALLSGLKTIPAIVKDFSELEALEVALIENIQREQLSALEEAEAYKNLLNMGVPNHEALAKKIGKTRSSVTNALRLLNLDDKVKHALQNDLISSSHARALLALENDLQLQKEILKQVIQEKWSVHKLEKHIQQLFQPKNVIANKKNPHMQNTNLAHVDQLIAYQKEINDTLGVQLNILGDLNKGKVEFPYKSNQELQKIVNILTLS